MQFQSTRPARGATPRQSDEKSRPPSFNPRAPHGARPRANLTLSKAPQVSIHAPRTGRDQLTPSSTGPGRVSIHAPRTGRDTKGKPELDRTTSFNPRAPHGARPSQFVFFLWCFAVSIHAPRTGRDFPRCTYILPRAGFNPRAPHGARRSAPIPSPSMRRFQSTRPARGATSIESMTATSAGVSIHAPRTGRDFSRELRFSMWIWVSIHAPRTGRDCKRHCHS